MPELGFNVEDLGKELGFVSEQPSDPEGALNVSRSGSAPPVAEGSRNSVWGVVEEELPLDLLHSNFPPRDLSGEEWRWKQRLGRLGERRMGSEASWHPAIGSGPSMAAEWTSGDSDRPIGLDLQENLADILQDDLGRTTSATGHLSQSTSRGPFALQEMTSVDGLRASRNAMTDPLLVARAPSSLLPHAGWRSGVHGINLSSAGRMEVDDIMKSMRDLEIEARQNYMFNMPNAENLTRSLPLSENLDPRHSSISSYINSAKASYHNPSRSSIILKDLSASTVGNEPVDLHMPTVASDTSYRQSDPMRSALPSTFLNAVGTGNVPPRWENAAAESAIVPFGVDSRAPGNEVASEPAISRLKMLHIISQLGINSPEASVLQLTPLERKYIDYLKVVEKVIREATNYNNQSLQRGNMGSSYQNLLGAQAAYPGTVLQSNRQYGAPYLGRSEVSNHDYYVDPTLGPHGPVRHDDRSLYPPSGLSGFTDLWRLNPTGNLDEGFTSPLLEEFKSNNIRCFELSDIVGHVAEFSADQYGSRFIQQKLETATTVERNIVFEEIMPRALSLMTDVFGNYVIQKIFELGNSAQVAELASLLRGHVLELSLQMYGCRVIQKAIEVASLDLQITLVAELNGHVIQCVRDQNGNHVIQKCIELIPQDAIHFIISSFYDQVVTLSTHPYGCRVIQRVLEHCDDPKTQQLMMNEIMQSVCFLAQDQYGNYVIQHVLQHGKPQEKSAIIRKLAGQIVKMSQQKFASNVVEKCLTYGGPEERQLLVKEMLGSTDENEPLQAMMKDQFGNYVVQKILETCDDEQRELILSRIKVHLNTLKKYTYGKHIVARVEKLVTAGERRSRFQPSYSS